MIAFPIYLFILIELLFVSVGDIKYRKIPNLWSILNILSAVALFILFPKAYVLEFESFTFSLTFFVVGFLLFLLNIMGGGDSKFLATFFFLIPLSLQESVFYLLLLSTIIIGGLFFINSLIRNHEEIIDCLKSKNTKGLRACFGTKFAFAPVILITWIWIGWTLKDQFLKTYF